MEIRSFISQKYSLALATGPNIRKSVLTTVPYEESWKITTVEGSLLLIVQ